MELCNAADAATAAVYVKTVAVVADVVWMLKLTLVLKLELKLALKQALKLALMLKMIFTIKTKIKKFTPLLELTLMLRLLSVKILTFRSIMTKRKRC